MLMLLSLHNDKNMMHIGKDDFKSTYIHFHHVQTKILLIPPEGHNVWTHSVHKTLIIKSTIFGTFLNGPLFSH